MAGKRSIAIAGRRASTGLRWSLLDFITTRIHAFHLFVLKMPIESAASAGHRGSDDRDPGSDFDFEMREITHLGDPDLDSLVALDGMRKSFAVESISNNHCYVAKREGRVVAATWSSRGPTCQVKELGRELGIPAQETYGWGTYCAPKYRGLNVVPRLVSHAISELARNHGKTACVGIVVTSNSRMLRAMGKLGFRKVGRIGYLQVGTFRLHYLIGSGAFRGTARRVLVERIWT